MFHIKIMVSRSLKEAVTDLPRLREILCLFIEKAGLILRREGMMASELHVVLRTSRYERDNAQIYANSASMVFVSAFMTIVCNDMLSVYMMVVFKNMEKN